VLELAVEAAVAGRDGEVLAGDLVAQLRSLGAAEPVATDTWTAEAPAGAGTLVRVRLAPDTPLRGVRAFIIVQMLGKVGDVVATEPSLEDLQFDGFERDFALKLITATSAAEIDRIVRRAGDVADVQV